MRKMVVDPSKGQVPWRQQQGGFPYKGITDKKYLKDRIELFRENGHGWYCNPTNIKSNVKNIRRKI